MTKKNMMCTVESMDKKHMKAISYGFALAVLIALICYASSVFLLAFAAILLAIFLNAVGRATATITRLPYPFALILAIGLIIGSLTLLFWLYSPIISEQFQLLLKQIPQASENLQNNLRDFFGTDFFSHDRIQKMFSLTDQKFLKQIVSLFSSTLGSIVSVVVILIVGLYLALDPERNMLWFRFLLPPKRQEKTVDALLQIGKSLKWWLIGKLFSMVFVGVVTFIGLNLLNVSLAMILAFLAGLLTFIPYAGAILSSIPGILVGFAQSPLKALYVTALYVGIHMVEGYFITPTIEQRTVSIPPAVTIMAQVLMMVLVGGVGLALATPLAVVAIAVLHRLFQPLK